MDVSKIAPYAKMVAAIGGAVVATAKLLSDGVLSQDDLQVIALAWATAYAVWRVPNKG